MTIRNNHIKPLIAFQRKIIRGFLKISDRAPIPSLYFLTGELPIEAKIQRAPPTRAEYKEYILTKITVYHERRHREAAETNSKMKYLNIKVKGLNGRPHPAIQGVSNTTDVKKLRAHIKMLCCDLYTYQVKAKGGSPHCRFC